MENDYRIVFRGGVREGFHRDQVRATALNRLKIDERQLERMFSGQRVVLKKGLDEVGGHQQLLRLQRLGMDVVLERPAAPQPAPSSISMADEGGFQDFERTHLNIARAEALLNGYPESAPAEAPEIRGNVFAMPTRKQGTPAESALTLNGMFICSHCGTTHQLEARIGISRDGMPSPGS